MDRLDLPQGLVRYTSERALEGGTTRVIRGRTVAYGLLLLAVGSIFTIALATRQPYDIDLGRAVGEPFVELADGTVGNRFRLRVRNQTATAGTFRAELLTPEGGTLRVGARQPVPVASRAMARVEGFLVVPQTAFNGAAQADAMVRLTFSDGTVRDVPFTLLGPSR
jgi:polyferredoxin